MQAANCPIQMLVNHAWSYICSAKTQSARVSDQDSSCCLPQVLYFVARRPCSLIQTITGTCWGCTCAGRFGCARVWRERASLLVSRPIRLRIRDYLPGRLFTGVAQRNPIGKLLVRFCWRTPAGRWLRLTSEHNTRFADGYRFFSQLWS
jgi:hypothetical protein